MAPQDSTVHKIRNCLQVLLSQYELSNEAQRQKLADDIRTIDGLVSSLDKKIGCPMEDKCPLMHPQASPAAEPPGTTSEGQ